MAPDVTVMRSPSPDSDVSPGHDDTEEEDEDEEVGWKWCESADDTCESDWSDSDFPQLKGNWTL
jgi:hypothetical protein